MSRAIRLVSTGKFNQNVPHHVAVIIAIHANIVVITEAVWGHGVRLQNLSVYNKDTVWIKRMKEPRDIQKGLHFLHDQLGLKYDRFAILGILARATFRLFGKRIYNRVRFMRNLIEQRTKFFCGEITSIYGKMTGKTLWHHPPSMTTPYDLFRSEQLAGVESVER